MIDISEIGGYAVALFKATIRLAKSTDTCYVLAQGVEDAAQQVRTAYADLNVLYIESIERLSGTVFLSQQARDILEQPSRKA